MYDYLWGGRVMGKILIVFGSKSDETVFNDIIYVLKEKGAHYEMRICSAHRTPEELDKILKEDYDVVIAGAGLAAHLPGVVASKTIRPVIGVPVDGNYQGLDALLSIMQMPPGIPVMSVGVNKSTVAGKMALLMLNENQKISLLGDKDNPTFKKAEKMFKEFNVSYEINPEYPEGIRIRFITLDEEATNDEELTLYVPMIEKEDDKAEAAINVLRNSTNGLWLGLNRGDNAALAAIEILNISGEYTDKLNKYRKDHADKIRMHDAEMNKK